MTISTSGSVHAAAPAGRRAVLMGAAAAILALAAAVDILVGPAFLRPGDVFAALFAPADAEATARVIVVEVRLPMSLMALAVGAALGLGGALMQTLLGNPLASPYTLGFSAAAGFGAALAILSGIRLPLLPHLAVPLAAFVSGGLAAGLVYGLSRVRGMSAEVMVLAGIATLFLFQSLQSLVQYMASPEVLQEIVFWLFGSLLKANWFSLVVACGVLAAVGVALAPVVWQLTALRLGEDRAAALGVDVRRLRVRVFVLVVLLTAGAVSFVGTIGFVGLIAPHLARALVGEDHRFLLPMSAAAGAIVMSAASVASKLVVPGGLVPIGIVTAMVGVPFLFALILKGRRRYW